MYVRFEDNIWVVNLAEIGSLTSKTQGVKYLLYVIDVFTKYLWVKYLKGKKARKVFNCFYWNSKQI